MIGVTIITLLVLLGLGAYYWRNGTIPIPLPESAWDSGRTFFGRPWLDTVWQTFLILVLLGVVYVLVQLGPVGAVLSFLIIASIARDEVQQWVSDLWNRDFAEV